MLFNFLKFLLTVKYFYRKKPSQFVFKSPANSKAGSQPPCISLGSEWCHHEWVLGLSHIVPALSVKSPVMVMPMGSLVHLL